jgi:transketolase
MTTAAPPQGESWRLQDLTSTSPGLSTLSDTLIELTEAGHPIAVCTADLKYSNGLVGYQERFADRFFQFGISEQNMVTASAGLATTGLLPYVATFASFLALLCCEQIRTDVAFTGQRVRLIGHHAGIMLGFYGTSHHATEDLGITRAMAGLTVIAPADRLSLAQAIRESVEWPEPIYFRIGRGREPDVYLEGCPEFRIGRAIDHPGRRDDLTIIATGSMVHPSIGAAEVLRAAGFRVGVLDMHTVKPLDREAVLRAATDSAALLTVEEHNVLTGLGSAVAEVVADEGLSVRLRRHGIHDQYSLIGPPTHLYRHYRLDSAGIAAVAREHIEDHRNRGQIGSVVGRVGP